MGCPNQHRFHRIDVDMLRGQPINRCLDCKVELVQAKCAVCGEVEWRPRRDLLSVRAAAALAKKA